MTDSDKIREHIASLSEDEEISDACARVIASQWHSGQASPGYSFVSTGRITTPADDVWRDLVYVGRRSLYDTASADDKRALDCLGTYLLNREDRGPVPGWSSLWL